MTIKKINKTNIIYRKFQLTDYEQVIQLWKKSKLPYKPNGRDNKISIKKEMKNCKNLFFVAEHQGQIIGSIFGTHDGRKGWINRLAVHPKTQRQGIGNHLVSLVEQQLSTLGVEIIAGLIETWNQESIQFFRQIGYTEHKDIVYFSKRKHKDV